MNFPLSPCVPENLVSRDGFSRPVPRQSAHLHTQAESGAYLRDSSRVPRRRPFIYLNHHTPSDQSRVPCSADHEQDWQPYPVDPYSAICDDHTYYRQYYYYTSVACTRHTAYRWPTDLGTTRACFFLFSLISLIADGPHHYRRYFQHAHFIPIVGVGKRGEY